MKIVMKPEHPAETRKINEPPQILPPFVEVKKSTASYHCEEREQNI